MFLWMLTRSIADAAFVSFGAGLAACSGTSCANDSLGVDELYGLALVQILERDLVVLESIRSPLGNLPGSSRIPAHASGKPTTHTAVHAEELVVEVAEVHTGCSSATLEGGSAVRIVATPFLIVAENFVRRGYLFEAHLGLCAAILRDFVRVPLKRGFLESLLDLCLRGRSRDAENLWRASVNETSCFIPARKGVP